MTHAWRRYCSVPTCPNRTDGGPCAEHSIQREHRRANFEWRKLYRRARWKRLREAVLADEPFCVDCDAKQLVAASKEVHHKIRPSNEDQFYNRGNLMALCTPCHSARTARGE